MGTLGTAAGTFATGACAGVGSVIGTGIGALISLFTAGISLAAGATIGAGVGAAVCGLPILFFVVGGFSISAIIAIAGIILTAGAAVANPIVSWII